MRVNLGRFCYRYVTWHVVKVSHLRAIRLTWQPQFAHVVNSGGFIAGRFENKQTCGERLVVLTSPAASADWEVILKYASLNLGRLRGSSKKFWNATRSDSKKENGSAFFAVVKRRGYDKMKHKFNPILHESMPNIFAETHLKI